MKIAVIGGGIFGVSTAFTLGLEHDVDLYETNSDIMLSASDVNQCRIHRGYHYPRSLETTSSLLKSEKKFFELFSSSIIPNIENYYCISKRDSLTSPNNYLTFCEKAGLEYEECKINVVDPDSVDLCVKVKENIFEHSILKKICWNKLQVSNVKIHLNTNVDQEIFKKYDHVVIATYADSNRLLSEFPEFQLDYQFEVCEKIFVKLPSTFHNKSILIMDGPFMSVDPIDSSNNFIIGDVVNTIHQRNTGKFPEFDEKFLDVLNKGLIKNPKISNYERFIKSALEFFPEITKAEYLGSSFCIKTVLANVDKTDERPTLVRQISPKITTIFSGKIPTCIEAAYQVKEIIDTKTRKIKI